MRLTILVLFIVSAFDAKAQYQFNSIVKDSATAQPLVGAMVVVDHSTNGAAADVDGKLTVFKLDYDVCR